MPRWYCSRERVKRAVPIDGVDRDAQVDRAIEAASRHVDSLTHCEWLPRTATRRYRWPDSNITDTGRLWVDQPLLSVSALTTENDQTASGSTSIAATDYFLEPQSLGPPYTRIEIDLSSTSFFASGDTPQRANSVSGDWGMGNDTEAAGALDGAIATAAATSMDVTNEALIDVGDTVLIDSERIFVSEKSTKDSTADVDEASFAADKSDEDVDVTDGSLFNVGEVILIGSEQMRITSIAANTLSIQRGYNGTTLAAHASGADIYTYRTLTIVRGELGSTAATHDDAATIARYVPDARIVELTMAKAIQTISQESSSYGRTVGQGEGQREVSGRTVRDLEQRIKAEASWRRVVAI